MISRHKHFSNGNTLGDSKAIQVLIFNPIDVSRLMIWMQVSYSILGSMR